MNDHDKSQAVVNSRIRPVVKYNPVAMKGKQMTLEKNKPYFSAAEARQYGIGEAAYYRFLREGKIKSIKIGRRYVVPREAFLEWYRSCGGQIDGGNHAA